MSDERLMVLKMLKEGKITVEEAEALLEALGEETPTAAGGGTSPGPRTSTEHTERFASLGAEIRDVVRKTLESVRPAVSVAYSARRAGWKLRDELRDLKGGVSLGGIVRDLFGLAEASEEMDLSHPIAPGSRLIVRNPRGDVRVVKSPGSEVRVHARKQCWWRTPEAAEGLLHHVQVTMRPEGNDVAVEVGLETVAPPPLRFRVDLTIEVPEGISAELDVKSGDVRVEGLTGDLVARIASGDLAVGPHGGKVQANVKSGDVSVEECRGDVEVAVQSGDLSLLVNGGGSVKSKVLSGDMVVRLASLAPGARVGLEVLAGDLEVEIAKTVQAAIRAEATAGDIEVALPLQNVQKTVRRVEGVLGSGDATVDLRVLSGDLSIQEG